MRAKIFLLIPFLFVTAPAHANIVIACGGYNPSINDHVEWELTIIGASADFEGMHYLVSETKRFIVLTRPGSQIRINKAAKSYVILGPKGRKAPAVEWSRKVPGEGFKIPKSN